jgi:hypothetical protein
MLSNITINIDKSFFKSYNNTLNTPLMTPNGFEFKRRPDSYSPSRKYLPDEVILKYIADYEYVGNIKKADIINESRERIIDHILAMNEKGEMLLDVRAIEMMIDDNRLPNVVLERLKNVLRDKVRF